MSDTGVHNEHAKAKTERKFDHAEGKSKSNDANPITSTRKPRFKRGTDTQSTKEPAAGEKDLGSGGSPMQKRNVLGNDAFSLAFEVYNFDSPAEQSSSPTSSPRDSTGSPPTKVKSEKSPKQPALGNYPSPLSLSHKSPRIFHGANHQRKKPIIESAHLVPAPVQQQHVQQQLQYPHFLQNVVLLHPLESEAEWQVEIQKRKSEIPITPSSPSSVLFTPVTSMTIIDNFSGDHVIFEENSSENDSEEIIRMDASVSSMKKSLEIVIRDTKKAGFRIHVG
jgi:hypothetical protein